MVGVETRQIRADERRLRASGLAMPVPEPETYAMMLLGLGVVGWMRRRRG